MKERSGTASGSTRLFPKLARKLLGPFPEEPGLAGLLFLHRPDADVLVPRGVEHVGRDFVVGAVVLEPTVDPIADVPDVDAGLPERREEEIGQDTKLTLYLIETFCEPMLTALVGLMMVLRAKEDGDNPHARAAWGLGAVLLGKES